MDIPRHWHRASENAAATGESAPIFAWGWGDTPDAAQQRANERLQQLVQRWRAADFEFDDSRYPYGARPLREEILQQFGPADAPQAVVTRNGYGCLVLNTAELLFIDVDVPPESFGDLARRWFGLKPDLRRTRILEEIRAALGRRHGEAFRVYQTAAGFRVLGVSQPYRPHHADTRELMESVGADPAFVRLCEVQQSFRARLTPKPWRCGVGPPDSSYPRDAANEQPAFDAWLSDYEHACQPYAACGYLETVGAATADPELADLVRLHDTMTRCEASLTLA